MGLDVERVLASHAEWKKRLHEAIVACEPLDAKTIGRHDQCPLGLWLHGEAKEKFGHLPSFGECVGAHAIFHLEAARVAQLVNQRRYVEAEFALNPAKAYDAASKRLTAAIGGLWRDAAVEQKIGALGA